MGEYRTTFGNTGSVIVRAFSSPIVPRSRCADDRPGANHRSARGTGSSGNCRCGSGKGHTGSIWCPAPDAANAALAAAHLVSARLVILTAFAPHQVSRDDIANFLSSIPLEGSAMKCSSGSRYG
jgi:hypothetical protein